MAFRLSTLLSLVAAAALLTAGLTPRPACAAPPMAAGEPSPTADPTSDAAVSAALCRQAGRFQRIGDFRQAVLLLTRALEVDPRNANANAERVRAQQSITRAEQEVARLNQRLHAQPAAQKHPSSEEIALKQARGRALYDCGRYAEALNDLSACLNGSLSPNNAADLYYLRGLVYAAQKDGENALNDYSHYLFIKGYLRRAAPAGPKTDPRLL